MQIFIPIILLFFDKAYTKFCIAELLQHLEDHQELANTIRLEVKALQF